MRALLIVAAIAVPLLASAAPDRGQAAHELVQLILDEKYDALSARFVEPAFAERVASMMKKVRPEAGAAKKWVETSRAEERGALVLTYRIDWERGRPGELRVALDTAGKVMGLSLRDAPDTSRDGYVVKATLRPPFSGTWTAYHASRDASNHHYGIANQRFAVDWLVTDEDKKTHRGDGKRNEDYYAYGKDALAVADGTVVTIVDGVPENVPGELDPGHLGGNEVVLDLGNGEFALYCHLVPGTATASVKVGQRVKAGQLVGKVGNSGNSSEPHLHFQIADSPRQVNAHAYAVKYKDVLLDGKPAALAWPTTGQRLAPR